MTKYFSIIILVLLSFLLSQSVETYIYNEANGDNASVKTEISNTVNGSTTKIESNKQGEIKVETKNGKTEVTTNNNVKISNSKNRTDAQKPSPISPKIVKQKEFKNQSFLRNFYLKLTNFLQFSFLTKLQKM